MADRTLLPPDAGQADVEPSPAPSRAENSDVPAVPAARSLTEADLLAFFESERTIADDAVAQNLQGVHGSRKRADAWGKGALGLATAVLTALGIGKLADFLPHDGAVNQIAATAGLVVALGAVMFVGLRLSRVSLPVVMRADLADMKKDPEKNPDGLKGPEAALVNQVYARFASLNGVKSVAEYAAVAIVIERTFTILADKGKRPADITSAQRQETIDGVIEEIHKGQDGTPTLPAGVVETYVAYTIDRRDVARAKAALVRAELRYVMTNALADLVDRRAVKATTGASSLVALTLIPIGVLVAVIFTYFANANETNRDQQWQDAKTCIEFATAVKQSGLAVAAPVCVFPAPPGPAAQGH